MQFSVTFSRKRVHLCAYMGTQYQSHRVFLVTPSGSTNSARHQSKRRLLSKRASGTRLAIDTKAM